MNMDVQPNHAQPEGDLPSSAAAAAPASKPDYEVGYRKPPKSGQFKPGQSGNPKGRPRKDRPEVSPIERLMAVEKLVTLPDGSQRRLKGHELDYYAKAMAGLQGKVAPMRSLMREALDLMKEVVTLQSQLSLVYHPGDGVIFMPQMPTIEQWSFAAAQSQRKLVHSTREPRT